MNTRLLLGACVMLLLATGADAQKKKKPNINKARLLWEKQELAEAKAIIDDATTYEKTMNNGKTWYYRGLIYVSIDTTTDATLSALSDNAMEIALQSFAKAEEIDPEEGYNIIPPGGGLPVLMNQQIDGWYGYYFTEAVTSYEAENYSQAYDQFMKSSMILPKDTNSVSNAGYAALNMDDDDKTMKAFHMAMDRGSKNKNIILNMINIYNGAENYDAALEVLAKAKEYYPSDNMLNRQEVDILRKAGKLDEARAQLELAIKNEPDNALLPFFLGILYDEDGDPEKAMEWYKNTLTVDPDYYDAHYNIAVLVYNKTKELQNEKSLLNPYKKEDQKRSKELEPLIKSGFEDAVSYWEKVNSLKPNQRQVMETLIYMYSLTGQNSKADELEKQLNALPKE